FPPQPASVTTEGAFAAMNWRASQGEDRYRRSLYTFSRRSSPFAAYMTFDAPSGELCCPRRDLSNTPLQSLTLMNSDLFMEPAQAAAKWLAADKRPVEPRIVELVRRALVRPPTEQEVASLAKFYRRQHDRFKSGKLDAKSLVGKDSAGPDELAA